MYKDLFQRVVSFFSRDRDYASLRPLPADRKPQSSTTYLALVPFGGLEFLR